MPDHMSTSEGDRLGGLLRRLSNDHSYHAPEKDSQVQFFQTFRADALALAERVAKEVPAGREQSLALTKIEEAVMHANAGVARNPERMP